MTHQLVSLAGDNIVSPMHLQIGKDKKIINQAIIDGQNS